MKKLLSILMFMAQLSVVAQPFDFQNTRLKDDQRINLFIGQLTLDEKISLSPHRWGYHVWAFRLSVAMKDFMGWLWVDLQTITE